MYKGTYIPGKFGGHETYFRRNMGHLRVTISRITAKKSLRISHAPHFLWSNVVTFQVLFNNLQMVDFMEKSEKQKIFGFKLFTTYD